jgi:hypothetical protein
MLDLDFEDNAGQQWAQAIPLALGAAAFLTLALSASEETYVFFFGLIGALVLLGICAREASRARESRTKCEEYRALRRQLEILCDEEDPSAIERGIRDICQTQLALHLMQLGPVAV